MRNTDSTLKDSPQGLGRCLHWQTGLSLMGRIAGGGGVRELHWEAFG